MDLALLVLRATGAVIMLAHGWPKWRRRDGIAKAWRAGGMPLPHLAVPAAYLAEVPGGVLYGLGLLTRAVSVVLILFMLIVTWWSIGVSREGLVSHGTKGYDVNLALLAIFIATALAGGGAYSLDAALGWTR